MTNNPTDDELRAIVFRLRDIDNTECEYTLGLEAADAITTLIEYRQQVQDLKDALIRIANRPGPGHDKWGNLCNEGEYCAIVAQDALDATLTKESRV